MILNTPSGYVTVVVKAMAPGTNVVRMWDHRITTPRTTRGRVVYAKQLTYPSVNLVIMAIYAPSGEKNTSGGKTKLRAIIKKTNNKVNACL